MLVPFGVLGLVPEGLVPEGLVLGGLVLGGLVPGGQDPAYLEHLPSSLGLGIPAVVDLVVGDLQDPGESCLVFLHPGDHPCAWGHPWGGHPWEVLVVALLDL